MFFLDLNDDQLETLRGVVDALRNPRPQDFPANLSANPGKYAKNKAFKKALNIASDYIEKRFLTKSTEQDKSPKDQ